MQAGNHAIRAHVAAFRKNAMQITRQTSLRSIAVVQTYLLTYLLKRVNNSATTSD
jgi:hypothetical protein